MKAGAQIVRLISAALLCGAAPAVAAPALASAAPAPAPAAAPNPLLAAAPEVDLYYRARGNPPIWFRDPASVAAASLLPSILKRGHLDGLTSGPELARMVEAALARVRNPPPPAPAPKTGKRGKRAEPAPPVTFTAEDKLLSAAWIQYVRALKAPIPGMLYGDPALAPKPPHPDRILAEAQRAPSLLQHIQGVAAVNPLYAQLRDAAVNRLGGQAQLGGGAALDPRLTINLHRARVLQSSGRYAVVNAATAQLFLYEDGRVVDSMKVVVGKRDTPTPMLAGTIHYVTFNPYWNIPPDVTQRVVAPLVLKRGTGYLRAAEYQVASNWSEQATVVPPDTIDWKAVAAGTTQVRIRQLPGANNMMGAIKFGFANDYGIYLHDTPQRDLFDKAIRDYSLGCVRVEDAQRFARWLLGREPVAPSDQPEQHVRLAKGVPIYITYVTAQPTDGGQLTFADDIYGLDPKSGVGLTAAATAPPASTGTLAISAAPALSPSPSTATPALDAAAAAIAPDPSPAVPPTSAITPEANPILPPANPATATRPALSPSGETALKN